MKFITASVHGEQFEWLFVIEGPARPGDIIKVGTYDARYMQVKRVGATRAAVKSEYDGAVKVIEAREPLKVARAVTALARANAAVKKAREELRVANGQLPKETMLKQMYGHIQVTGPRMKAGRVRNAALARELRGDRYGG